ncbi:MAG: flagellar M-ring protein FliF [Oscillospiraceae bacterium]|nr:flagellar M-ring protein FliF [Oscillospiraceae bacterium]
MNEQVQKVVRTVTTFWEAQDKKRKILYIALLAAIILIAVITAIILNRKEYIVLYEGLETSEASEMVALIEDMGYSARLSSGTISVPLGTENYITMQLAMQNYPKSGTNYPLTTTATDLFSTETERREYARIDLENRLSALIGSMDTIGDAVVTLAIPQQKNTVITANREYPTASVVVYLDGITKLSNEQIIGIKNVVKTSVVGLIDDNIEIVDGMGIPQFLEEDEITSYDRILDETRKLYLKRNIEGEIRDKILALFIPAYGEDGVSVAVNMVLNFDAKVSETTDYGPDSLIQHADGSNAWGGTTVDGGVVGVEYNADDTYPTGDTTGRGDWGENSFSNTYLVDTYKEQVEKEGFTIDQLSIAVVLYTDYLSENQRADMVRLVGNAGSVNPQIVEDVVTVTNLAKYIDPNDIEVVKPTYLFGLTFDQLILVGAIVIILILVILIALAILSGNAKKKRKAFEQQIIETSGLALADGEEPVDMFVLSDAEDLSIIPSLSDEEVETKEVVIRREITEFAQHSPEIVAQLLKNWIKNEEE